MRRKSPVSLLFWLILAAFEPLLGQSGPPPKPVLPLAELLAALRANSPTARQADNLIRSAAEELTSARGLFDPKAFGSFERKTFGGKTYYAVGELGAKLPTRFGAELKAGYATASGVFLDPSEQLPTAGQAVIGISQPLLQGLFFDDRRAALRRARQGQDLLAAERALALNDLFLSAIEAYWKWSFAEEQLQIAQRAAQAARTRYQNIKIEESLGERMAMDTLEAALQLQDRLAFLAQAELEKKSATAKLDVFIWPLDGRTAQDFLPEKPPLAPIAPEFSKENRADLERAAAERHPALRSQTAKIEQLRTDRRLKAEKLKPKLSVSYSLLGAGADLSGALSGDHKFGAELSSPFIFRTERAETRLADLKIERAELGFEQKRREIAAKLRAAFAEWDAAAEQLAIAERALGTARQLLELEAVRFGMGESAFFLMNAREQKAIEAELKAAKSRAEAQARIAAVRWALGDLGD